MFQLKAFIALSLLAHGITEQSDHGSSRQNRQSDTKTLSRNVGRMPFDPRSKKPFGRASEKVYLNSRIEDLSPKLRTLHVEKTSSKLQRRHVIQSTPLVNSYEDVVGRESTVHGEGSAPRKWTRFRGRTKAFRVNSLERKSENGNEYKWRSEGRDNPETILHDWNNRRNKDNSRNSDQSETSYFPWYQRLDADIVSQGEKDAGQFRVRFSYPLDLFLCGQGHCACHVTSEGRVYAKCSNRALRPMKDDCLHLPKKLYSFDISNQHMRSFPIERLLVYPMLFFLDVSRNPVHRLRFLITNKTLAVRSVKFSACSLFAIDCSFFPHMPRVRELFLDNNLLTSIDKCTFGGNKDLEYLDLSHNLISTIERGSFESQSRLRVLFLHHNRFNYFKQLTPNILSPLQQLEVLWIHASKHGNNVKYPDVALSRLQSIREISVDGLMDAEFGSTMNTLRNLTSLNIGFGPFGICALRNVTCTFFQHLPFLRSVTISHCHKLKSFCPQAFTHIPEIENLAFLDIRYPLKRLLSEFTELRNSSIRKLTLNRIQEENDTHGFLQGSCHFLGEKDARSLHSMSSLEELNLDQNLLNVLLNSFVTSLPKSLRKLSLSKNMLTSLTSVLKHGWSLKNLTVLDETQQLHVNLPAWGDTRTDIMSRQSSRSRNGNGSQTAPGCNDNSVSQSTTTSESKRSGETVSCEFVELFPSVPGVNGAGESTLKSKEAAISGPSSCPHQVKTGEAVGLDDASDEKHSKRYAPPNLVVYTAADSYRLGLTFGHKGNTVLKVLNISNTYFNNWGTLFHLSPSVEVVDLSSNYCKVLHNRFVYPNNSLIELYMQRNLLGETFARDEGKTLMYCTNVQVINLSDNFIYHLPRISLTGLVNAQFIDLSKNRIQHFDVILSHMTWLKILDLSNNAIEWISPGTRHDLDNIALNHTVFLNLNKNPLPCTCAGIELLQWIATTNVEVVSKDFLSCRNEKDIDYAGDFESLVKQLKRSCTSQAYVIVLSASLVTMAFLVIGAGVLYRYRWKFIYWKNITVAKYFGSRRSGRHKENDTTSFTFDGFVLYSQEDRDFVLGECLDELESKRGHRLCVEDRDFLLGSYLPGDITSAIQKSYLTLPVLSPDFLEDKEWCEYGLQMALMEAVYSRRPVLHPLLILPVPAEDMSRDILQVLKRGQFSEYPPEEADSEVRQAFWDSVSRRLGHVGQVNT